MKPPYFAGHVYPMPVLASKPAFNNANPTAQQLSMTKVQQNTDIAVKAKVLQRWAINLANNHKNYQGHKIGQSAELTRYCATLCQCSGKGIDRRATKLPVRVHAKARYTLNWFAEPFFDPDHAYLSGNGR